VEGNTLENKNLNLSLREIMNYPSIKQVMDALGKHTENPEVMSLFDTLGISEANLKSVADLNNRKSWADTDFEIRLNFEDIGSLIDIPYHDIGEGPWVLTDVFFWSDVIKETKQSYGGPLPYGINFSMNKNEVQKLFSEPRIIDNERVDAWMKGEHRLVVNYDIKSKKIRSISLGLPPPPLSE